MKVFARKIWYRAYGLAWTWFVSFLCVAGIDPDNQWLYLLVPSLLTSMAWLAADIQFPDQGKEPES
jgi:hypothetical protein